MILTTRRRKGYALLLTVVAAFFLGAIAVVMFRLQVALHQNTLISRYREIALRAAEAGVERAIQRISFDPSYTATSPVQEDCWPGASGPVTCTYSYTVTGSGSTKAIHSVGKVSINGFGGQINLTVTVQRNPSEVVIVSWEEH